jgi:hypothetical protein
MLDNQRLQRRIADIAASFKAYLDLTQKDKTKVTKGDQRRVKELEKELRLVLEPEERTDLTVDVHSIAKFFGITTRAVQMWVQRGCPKLKHGMYDLQAVFKWWVEMFAKGEESAAIEEVKLDYWRWKATNERIKAETAQGQLVPKGEIAMMWAARMGEVVAGLQAFTYRLPPLLEGKSQIEMLQIIKEEQWLLRDNFCREGKFCPPSSNGKPEYDSDLVS